MIRCLCFIIQTEQRRCAMGVYLNPTTNDFTGKITVSTFVDQTEMLAVIADKVNDTDHKYIAVSRP